jgi:hypothetical protein
VEPPATDNVSLQLPVSLPAASRERHAPPVARGRLGSPREAPFHFKFVFPFCSHSLLHHSNAARCSANACPSPVRGK